MIKELKVEKTIEIKANARTVWNALTDPDQIKKYLFGTEVVTDWKAGSTIIFQGEWEGKKYKDKGVILEIEAEKLIRYSYWTGFSGLEDKEENYSIITYQLSNKGDITMLVLSQEGFASEQGREHADKSWEVVLEGFRGICEG